MNEKIKNTNDYMKLEIAEELGLLDKVANSGWQSLTAQEAGRIGGILSSKKKKMQKIV